MSEEPAWIQKVVAALETAIEFESPGSFEIALGEDGQVLAVAPCLVEFVDDDQESEEGFPFYNLELRPLMNVFDNSPNVAWHTRDSSIWLEGKIDGVDACVLLQGEPFEDAEPSFVVDSEGNIREKEAMPEDAAEGDLSLSTFQKRRDSKERPN